MQPISINGHKVNIQLRDIIWFITTGVALVAIYFATQNSSSNQKKEIADLYSRIASAEVEAKIAHDTNILQGQQIAQNVEQISDIYRTMRELGPKVDKIDANVLWLMGKQIEKK